MMSPAPAKCSIHEILYHYVDKRDIKNVKKLLAQGASETKISMNGRSAVGHAAFKNYPEILELLLENCKLESSYDCGSNAAKKPRTESEPMDRTPEGMDGLQWDDEMESETSPLSTNDEWSRLYKYYAKMFEQTGALLVSGHRVRDPHCLDACNQAPIHYAAALGHIECLNILLRHRSPVDIATKNGVTSLHLALTARNEEIVRILLSLRADPNRKIYNTGSNAMHVAAKLGNVKMVQLLLEAGAMINSVNQAERTPLMTAIQNRNSDVAAYLINAGAKLNLQDSVGYTALYYAVMTNQVELARLLLDNGARLFVTHYLIHACVRFDFLEMAKLLVAAGENVNVKDAEQHTPLYLAIKNFNAPMVEFLFDNGASSFQYDPVKELHVAVQHAETVSQFAKVARIAIAKGASMNGHNSFMETPLSLAIMMEKYQIAEFLIKEGVDVNKGRTSNFVINFLLARRSSHLNLLMLLA